MVSMLKNSLRPVLSSLLRAHGPFETASLTSLAKTHACATAWRLTTHLAPDPPCLEGPPRPANAKRWNSLGTVTPVRANLESHAGGRSFGRGFGMELLQFQAS